MPHYNLRRKSSVPTGNCLSVKPDPRTIKQQLKERQTKKAQQLQFYDLKRPFEFNSSLKEFVSLRDWLNTSRFVSYDRVLKRAWPVRIIS